MVVSEAERFVLFDGYKPVRALWRLARKAVQNGPRALLIRARDLFDELYASLADRSTRRRLRTLAGVDLLAAMSSGT